MPVAGVCSMVTLQGIQPLMKHMGNHFQTKGNEVESAGFSGEEMGASGCGTPVPGPKSDHGTAGPGVIVRSTVRITVALGLLAGLVHFGFLLHGHPDYGRTGSFTLISGAAFGVLLQRSRFCFFCCLHDLFEDGDSRGVLGILTALVIGSIGYMVMMGAWIADPSAGYLPRTAHIGPVSWPLAAGGLAFGIGMAFSGSCISAHLYRLGEGSVLAPFALAGALGGFVLGFLSWNFLYLNSLATAPVIWIPEHTGYAGALALQVLVFAVMGCFLLRWIKRNPRGADTDEPITLKLIIRKVFSDRWPTWAGGIGVGILAVFTLIRTEPLGVTAELGRISRTLGTIAGWLPERFQGLDGFAGCVMVAESPGLSQNAIFVLALVGASLMTALWAGQFKPVRQPVRNFPMAVLGGVLLGWGAMVSLGCTIGTTLSGIMAFAASGWVFTLAMIAGVWLGIRVRSWSGI